MVTNTPRPVRTWHAGGAALRLWPAGTVGVVDTRGRSLGMLASDEVADLVRTWCATTATVPPAAATCTGWALDDDGTITITAADGHETRIPPGELGEMLAAFSHTRTWVTYERAERARCGHAGASGPEATAPDEDTSCGGCNEPCNASNPCRCCVDGLAAAGADRG